MSFAVSWSRFGVLPLKHLSAIRSSNVDKVVEPDEHIVKLCNYVDVYYNERIHAGLNFSTGSAKPSEIARFGLKSGDIIITKDSETPDDIAVPALVPASIPGVVCGYHLALLRPDKRRISSEYLFYALKSRPLRDSFTVRAQGITRFGLTMSGIGSVLCPVPDLGTQRVIADFLDRETARIDQLIEKKDRMLGLILERQAARLDRLTFNAPTNQHWERVPFKWICRIPNGQVDPKLEPWSDLPLIAPNHIESGTGRILFVETAREQAAESGKYAYPAGTVLYSKIRPALAKACIAPEGGLCSADMYPIIPSRKLLPTYLLMQLLSQTFTDWASLKSMRVAMPKINRETLGAFRLLVPPIEEQHAMVRQRDIDKTCADALVASLSESNDRLRERYSALITAAVTGQIDVATWGQRGAADRRLEAIEAYEMAGDSQRAWREVPA